MKTIALNEDQASILAVAVKEHLCFLARSIAEDREDPVTIEDSYRDAAPLFEILKLMGEAVPEEFWGEPENVDRCYQNMKTELAS